MSATKQHCKTQAWRVMNFCKAAKEDDQAAQVAREVLEALLRNCQSDEHATAVVTAFIESPHYPGDVIADLVAIARRTEQHEQPPAGCDHCAIGPDVSTGEMRWASHVSLELASGVSYAARCQCPRGLWLLKQDAKRANEPAPQPRKAPKPERPDVRQLAAGEDR